MSIQVDTLTKVYGQQKAVDGISFTAGPGVLGFLGPNGAGKSTTMKILTCFIPQTSGSASVCGFDVQTQSLEVRRRIGYLPESNPLYQDMYVKESLGFISGIHDIHQ
ncbi:MAG: ATP-binding cassette domain-containing protein, partial [Mucilaginibacter sp.]